MANLFDRLFTQDPGVENIAVHQFTAAVLDYMAGQTTRAQIIAAWSLDASAQTDLNALLNEADAQPTLQAKLSWALQFDSVNILAESGLKYTTRAAYAARLGITE